MSAAGRSDPWAYIRWARECAAHYELRPIEAHALLLFSTYADPQGEAYPLLSTIEKRVRRGDSELSKAVGNLQRLEFLERHRRGPGRAALTRLLPDLRPAGDQGALPDLRSAGAKTSGEPDPRPPASRRQNYQGNGHKNPVGPRSENQGGNGLRRFDSEAIREPTEPQLNTIRGLSEELGVEEPMPRTRQEAGETIEQLVDQARRPRRSRA